MIPDPDWYKIVMFWVSCVRILIFDRFPFLTRFFTITEYTFNTSLSTFGIPRVIRLSNHWAVSSRLTCTLKENISLPEIQRFIALLSCRAPLNKKIGLKNLIESFFFFFSFSKNRFSKDSLKF